MRVFFCLFVCFVKIQIRSRFWVKAECENLWMKCLVVPAGSWICHGCWNMATARWGVSAGKPDWLSCVRRQTEQNNIFNVKELRGKWAQAGDVDPVCVCVCVCVCGGGAELAWGSTSTKCILNGTRADPCSCTRFKQKPVSRSDWGARTASPSVTNTRWRVARTLWQG